jgi:hypothetical protein
MLFAARNYQLQTVEANGRLRTVTQQVDILIKDALEKICALEVTREPQDSNSEASKCSVVDLPKVRLESLGNNVTFQWDFKLTAIHIDECSNGDTSAKRGSREQQEALRCPRVKLPKISLGNDNVTSSQKNS